MEVINNIDYNEEELLLALEKKDVKKVREIFDTYNLVDIADTLSKIDNIETHMFIFKTVPSELTSIVFSYLDNDVQEDIINKLTSEELTTILENQYSDDIVDFIQEMPANLVGKILKAAPAERRAEINQLLSYKDDSAGSIMTTEYIKLKETDNYKEAISKVKKFGKRAESITHLFVCDDTRNLRGTVHLRDLIYLEEDETVKDVMDKDFVYVYTDTDQEEVAKTMSKYDLNVVAVLNKENKLVGIITSDDIIDVIEEENTEDIHKMANVNPLDDEYNKTSAFTLAKNGVGWLVLLMLLSTFTSFIMNKFEDQIAIIPCLSIFIPMLIGTAGNAGNQTSAVIVRALGLGEIDTKDYIKVAGKELFSSLLVGLGVGAVNCVWIYGLCKIGLIDLTESAVPEILVGLLVSIAMVFSIMFAKFIAASLPLVCKALKIDPALLAGPMCTTLVDATSLLIYFVIALSIFPQLR